MDPAVRTVAGRDVQITSPTKPYFPKLGLNKIDVVDYFISVSEPMLEILGDRPVLLERYPNGVKGKSFFQKRIPDSAPEWLDTTTVETVNGTPSRALVLADAAHLVWAVSQGAFVLHAWPTRVEHGDVDELRIDLDPTPGITFEGIRESGSIVREELSALGIESWVKTSGSKGLHVHVPIERGYDSYQVRGAAVTIARLLAAKYPDTLTDRWWKEERGQRVFVDFNQNAPHKTMFSALAIRARVGAQVSTPIPWDDLDDVTPDELTVQTVPDYLEDGFAWHGMYSTPQDISALVSEFEGSLETVGDAPWPPVYPKQPFEPPRVAPSRAKSTDE